MVQLVFDESATGSLASVLDSARRRGFLETATTLSATQGSGREDKRSVRRAPTDARSEREKERDRERDRHRHAAFTSSPIFLIPHSLSSSTSHCRVPCMKAHVQSPRPVHAAQL
jgi:hypothetical protein